MQYNKFMQPIAKNESVKNKKATHLMQWLKF